MNKSQTNQPNNYINSIIIRILFILFAIIYAINNQYDKTIETYSSAYTVKNGLITQIGPINIDKNNTIYRVEVESNFTDNNKWMVIYGDIIDSQGKYIFSFMKDLYDNHNKPNNNSLYIDTTFKKTGKYHIDIGGIIEKDVLPSYKKPSQIKIKVYKIHSSQILYYLIILSIIIALFNNQSWIINGCNSILNLLGVKPSRKHATLQESAKIAAVLCSILYFSYSGLAILANKGVGNGYIKNNLYHPGMGYLMVKDLEYKYFYQKTSEKKASI